MRTAGNGRVFFTGYQIREMRIVTEKAWLLMLTGICCCSTICAVPPGAAIAADHLPAEEAATAAFPGSERGHKLLALESYLQSFRYPPNSEKRIGLLLNVLDQDPSARMPRLMLGKALLGRKQAETYAPRLLLIASKHAGSLELVNFALQVARRSGKFENAEYKLVNQALRSVGDPASLPDSERYLYLRLVDEKLAEYKRERNFEAAEQLLDGLLENERFPEQDLIRESAGRFYRYAAGFSPSERRFLGLLPSLRSVYQDKFDRIAAELAESEVKLQTVPELRRRLALYQRMGLFDDAMRIARRIYVMQPNESNLAQEVDCAMSAGRYDAALVLAEELRKKYPALSRIADMIVCRALADSGRIEEAVKFLDQLPPGKFRTEQELYLYFQGRDYKKFRKAFLAYDHKTPCKSPELLTFVLVAAEKLRDPSLLRLAAERLKKIDRLEDPLFANSVGYISAELNIDLPEAERLIRLAVAVDSRNSAFLDSLAWVQFRRGNLKEARKNIELALSCLESPEDAGTILFHAGEIALAQGEPAAALDYFRRALTSPEDIELDPEAVRVRIDELEKTQQ